MSLNNIQLPAVSIGELYKRSLVEIINNPTSAQTQPVSSFSILGKNLSRIVLIVNNGEVAFVPDEELNFLLGILSACKLNMDDVGILNIAKYPDADYKKVGAELSAVKVFLFGVDPDVIKLPLAFPYYQVQRYNDQTYLSAPALAAIQNDKAEKTKLWNSLKQIFSI